MILPVSIDQIYAIIVLVIVLIILFVIWRISYLYRKQKADLSKVVLKLGENQIDNEIAAMDLKSLIDHANSRNQQSDSSSVSDAKSNGSTSGGNKT